MPANKNALIRYMYLDQMLSDHHHFYTRSELFAKCNEHLRRDGFCEVSKRTIEMDLVNMSDAPFNLEISDDTKYDGKHVVRYKDPTRTLFSKPLSNDEKILLREMMKTVGKFSGIECFSWMQNLQEKLDADNSSLSMYGYELNNFQNHTECLISFEDNPYLRNKEYLPVLFQFIHSKQTIHLSYKKFTDNIIRHFSVYPYMLKQYRCRWYLLGTPVGNETQKYDPNVIITIPLDRIEGDILPDMKNKFKECGVNIEENLEEIVGVTYYKNNPLEEIVFAIKQESAPYIETKPIHETQRLCKDHTQQIAGYQTYCIECRYNHELLSLLLSFGDELIVISPTILREKIIRLIKNQLHAYHIDECEN